MRSKRHVTATILHSCIASLPGAFAAGHKQASAVLLLTMLAAQMVLEHSLVHAGALECLGICCSSVCSANKTVAVGNEVAKSFVAQLYIRGREALCTRCLYGHQSLLKENKDEILSALTAFHLGFVVD